MHYLLRLCIVRKTHLMQLMIATEHSSYCFYKTNIKNIKLNSVYPNNSHNQIVKGVGSARDHQLPVY